MPPFRDFGRPILERNFQDGIIDPHYFKDSDNKSYLLWKNNNWPLWPSEIYIAELYSNGFEVKSRKKLLLKAKFFYEWHIIEAPWIAFR